LPLAALAGSLLIALNVAIFSSPVPMLESISLG